MSKKSPGKKQRQAGPYLFRPITLRSVTARNRVMFSPMCQCSARDGVPNEWHFAHLAARAVGGCGIVFTEATHIEARGRITPSCVGLWNDEQRDAYAPIARFIGEQGAVPAIQIKHAGRKSSLTPPWDGNRNLTEEEGGWPVLAPSAKAFSDDYPLPVAMDDRMIGEVLDANAAAARRARQAGFKIIEFHAAHGYLVHSFLSPLSNERSDGYGGAFENRIRFFMEMLDALQSEWPDELPVFVRLSCTDWIEGGWDLDDSVRLAHLIKQRGDVDLIDCSSGGIDPHQEIPTHPGYQVPFAERIRREVVIPTAAVGLLQSPELAEAVVANGQADIVAIGRGLFADPYWPLHAAKALGAAVAWPKQYATADII